MIEISEVTSPLGDIRVATRDGVLCGLGFADTWERVDASLEKRFPGVDRRVVRKDGLGVKSALAAYFKGELDALDGIPVDLGGTEFQRKVWEQLAATAPGDTVSYAEVAARVGSARAVRAVGTASGSNPVCLVIPCHRMVRSDGHLGGYGGRLERKVWLLEHEGAYVKETSPR